jgi:hypothetical protein
MGQARQFIETCVTWNLLYEKKFVYFGLVCYFCPSSQKSTFWLPNMNEYLTTREYVFPNLNLWIVYESYKAKAKLKSWLHSCKLPYFINDFLAITVTPCCPWFWYSRNFQEWNPSNNECCLYLISVNKWIETHLLFRSKYEVIFYSLLSSLNLVSCSV